MCASIRSLITGLAIATFFTSSCKVLASSSVNVALEASFSSGPYLLELLESAAEENQTCYYPILDRIADGYFNDAITDKELYDRFLLLLQQDAHLKDEASISSFKFSLSIRAAAPRIEAHYQYYNTSVEPSFQGAQDAACPVWVHFDGQQYCSSTMKRAQQDMLDNDIDRELPYDRILGDTELPPATLYADIMSPSFGEFHNSVVQMVKEGKASYRLRYKPSAVQAARPLFLHGYGVELALKRTDYIVIDDRQAVTQDKADNQDEIALTEEVPADIKPLSKTELLNLGVNAASFIMDSKDPFLTLLGLLEDFPRQSSAIANFNATPEFLAEFKSNRNKFLPSGYNVVWINGLQIDPRDVNAFSLLETLRRERALVENFRKLGLTTAEIVDLLAHPSIALAQENDEPQRFNYRDDAEGGRAIIWLNDIEKDSRYEGWPTTMRALLQRTYPGQMPAVRRDIQNVVMPLDLSGPQDVNLLLEALQNFVKRKIPVRFGIVPVLHSDAASEQAKIAYQLADTYGLGALLRYLQQFAGTGAHYGPNKAFYEEATRDAKLRRNKVDMPYEELNTSEELAERISKTSAYLMRLGIIGDNKPFFINGAVFARDENWLQTMSTRISMDLASIQRGVMEDMFEEDSWLPSYFLLEASQRRSSLVSPEDAKTIKVHDIIELDDVFGREIADLPKLLASQGVTQAQFAHMIVIADVNTAAGSQLLAEAVEFKRLRPGMELTILHNPASSSPTSAGSAALYKLIADKKLLQAEDLIAIFASQASRSSSITEALARRAADYWEATRELAQHVGFGRGENGILLNGRALGPIPEGASFGVEDFEALLEYEGTQRLIPVTRALEYLSLGAKIKTPLDFAKLTSLIARSTLSDVPEGIFDSAPAGRINKPSEWTGEKSAIRVSESEDDLVYIVAALDPTSDVAQRWAPIFKAISELKGVRLTVFMNPRERISELPIKRFYRHVLDSSPVFDKAGSLVIPEARFEKIPVNTLLNLAMDVPPSWLVAPKNSVYDLDNIKLANLDAGTDINAIYELENILIDGHSRDAATKQPPRGVQLLLGTDRDSHYADTIIMANIGYFQFKANPGYWKINLKPGRSQEIYNLDSVGALGHTPVDGDETNEVALFSFQGKTLFPRLSRKPGQEQADVLENGLAAGSILGHVSNVVQRSLTTLAKYGIPVSPAMGVSAISSFNQRLESLKSKVGLGVTTETHADINIFSVASGHLYERMMNIMMVSVMKNTKHTVKFWFIEQFLSPSFKDLLPHVAKHYGFEYEMVTYKWPHWLRAQQEKQREIWGYKILFLDVLFPLSLEKVIFVDADQIVRTDMYDLVQTDLEGAPYGFTPMGDSREEMEGFRFWKQGYWQNFLRGLPYHISALYVVDLQRFRQMAAGDRLRQQYQMLSADKDSLSNLDQDLPNHMQHMLPIKSLDPSWLWCETWCADSELATAKTIDLCNNPLTKEPKLDRARRQVPEWNIYDEEIAEIARTVATRKTEMSVKGHDEL